MSSTLEQQLNAGSYKSSNLFNKLLDSKDKTIEEILNDEDFLSEVRIQNEVLFNYLDYEKVKEMIDILLTEPSLSNTNIKSFKIPFIICEVFCLDVDHFTDKLLNSESNYELFMKLIGYFKRGDSSLLLAGQDESAQIDSSGMADITLPFDNDGLIEQTLACYISKIITFLCLKRPDQVVDCVSKNLHLIEALTNHMYLTECISDILVKLVCLRITDADSSLDQLKDIQKEIMSILIKIIDDSSSDVEKLDQVFETIRNISRRCYLVYNNRAFFSNWFNSEYLEELMGDSFFERLLKFIFYNSNKDLNKSVVKCLESIHTTINNLFISSPVESDQDVAEYQFGFIVQSIGGKSIEEIKQENNDVQMNDDVNESSDINNEIQDNNKTSDQSEQDNAAKKSSEKETDNNEFKLLEKNSNKKKSVLESQKNIFTPSEGRIKIVSIFMKYCDRLFDFLEKSSVEHVESKPKKVKSHRRSVSLGINGIRSLLPQRYLEEPIERTIIARMLSLFDYLLFFQSTEFLKLVKESDILKFIVDLCELYDDHSLIQSEIRMIFTTILKMEDINIKKKLLNDSRLILLFAKKVNMVDFSNMLAKKHCRASQKCIYTTIKHTVTEIENNMDIRMESALEEMQINWSIIKNMLEKDTIEIEEAKNNPKEDVEGKFKTPNHIDTDKIIRHQTKKEIVLAGGVSSHLVKSAVEARKRLEGLESFGI